MNQEAQRDAVGAPIALTLFAIAFGAFLWVFTGPAPFVLYAITTPFAIVLIWLSRNYRAWDEPSAHRDAPARKPIGQVAERHA